MYQVYTRVHLHTYTHTQIYTHILERDKSYDKSRQHIKKQRYHLADKGLYSQSYGFSSSYVWI